MVNSRCVRPSCRACGRAQVEVASGGTLALSSRSAGGRGVTGLVERRIVTQISINHRGNENASWHAWHLHQSHSCHYQQCSVCRIDICMHISIAPKKHYHSVV